MLQAHWYWQDLAQGIAKWHLSSIEALPSAKFWKSENGPISRTMKNIVLKFCLHIDIDKMYPMRLSNDIWDRSRFSRGSNSEKKWNWPYPLNLLVYFDKILHTYYYWHNLDRMIAKSSPRDCKMTFNIGRGCAELQILKKVKMAELSRLLWWNFAYTLILTGCSPRDCQMSFGIDQGVAEVQILKKRKRPEKWQ